MGTISKLWSVLTVGAVGASLNTRPENETEVGGPASSLFRCPSCKSVYIAIEMAECSSCQISVEVTGPNSPYGH